MTNMEEIKNPMCCLLHWVFVDQKNNYRMLFFIPKGFKISIYTISYA